MKTKTKPLTKNFFRKEKHTAQLNQNKCFSFRKIIFEATTKQGGKEGEKKSQRKDK